MSAHNILIVDDEGQNRDYLSEILSQEGYNVSSASNGKDAIAKLSQDAFNVVLTDLQMPELDGLEPSSLYLSWIVTVSTTRSPADVSSVFMFVEEMQYLYGIKYFPLLLHLWNSSLLLSHTFQMRFSWCFLGETKGNLPIRKHTNSAEKHFKETNMFS